VLARLRGDERLAAHFARVPVIAFSSLARAADLVTYRAAGFDGWIGKPVESPDEFRSRVATYLADARDTPAGAAPAARRPGGTVDPRGRRVPAGGDAAGEAAGHDAALARPESRFGGILETVRAAAVCLDGAGRVTFCNDFLLELTGWSRPEVLGSRWCDRFVPSGHEVGSPLRALIARGEVPPPYEADLLTRTGERRTVRWGSAAVRDDGGRVVGTVSIGHDVTAHVRAARATDERIGAVGHDLRSALGAVTASLQLLRRQLPALGGRELHLLDMAGRNAERALHLADDLLDRERVGPALARDPGQGGDAAPPADRAAAPPSAASSERVVTR
jgi:PAS domain S-box-containing protein